MCSSLAEYATITRQVTPVCGTGTSTSVPLAGSSVSRWRLHKLRRNGRLQGVNSFQWARTGEARVGRRLDGSARRNPETRQQLRPRRGPWLGRGRSDAGIVVPHLVPHLGWRWRIQWHQAETQFRSMRSDFSWLFRQLKETARNGDFPFFKSSASAISPHRHWWRISWVRRTRDRVGCSFLSGLRPHGLNPSCSNRTSGEMIDAGKPLDQRADQQTSPN